LFLEIVDIDSETFFQIQTRGFDNVEEYLDGGNLFAFFRDVLTYSLEISLKKAMFFG
jgi:hypothetical protein